MKSFLFDYLFDGDMSQSSLGIKNRSEISIDILCEVAKQEQSIF